MFARTERRRRRRNVCVVGRRNDDEVDGRQRAGFFERRHDGNVGQVRVYALRAARADGGELEAGRGTDERRVKRASGVAVSNQRDADHVMARAQRITS